MSYISLLFDLVRKEKKITIDLLKSYGASHYIRRLPYIRNEDPNFKNWIIDIVNNRSDLRKSLLATSDYGKNIRENINAVVADGKFNPALVRTAIDKKNRGVFEPPIPLSVTFKDAKKIDMQNPIIGNLLSQINANKISDAKLKQLFGKKVDDDDDNNVGGEELRRRYTVILDEQ